MAPAPQQNLVLLLARDLASNTASAFLIVDADGDLFFYNEHAEHLIGRSFAEAGPMGPEQWGLGGEPEDPSGRRIELNEHPLMVALEERRPAHAALCATTFEGKRRDFAVTAIPLIAQGGELVGGAAIFWEREEGEG